MKKKLISIIAVMVCVSVFVTNVFAYPISPNTYKMTTTPADYLTDEESVVWESTDPQNEVSGSPAICISKTGRIIVSYDITGTGETKGEVQYSDDGGQTWVKATMTDDAFLFARPFETSTGLYIIARKYAAGTTEGYGQLIVLKSTDDGATWGEANVIDEGIWHSAPTEVIHLNGYIYMTWEAQDKAAAQVTGGAGRGILAPVILRAEETADLTVASNWTISDSEDTYLSYYEAVGGNSFNMIDYMGIPFMHYRFGDASNTMGWLEGNIVRITDPSHVLYDENAFYIYLRSTANTSDYANLMKVVENEDGTMTSELVTTPSGKTNLYVQLPGAQSKFYITYDEQEEMYWLVSNVSTDSMEIDTTWGEGADTSRHEGPQDVRNELGLYYSSNAMDWSFAGIVSATDSISQARSYPSMVIKDNDLLVVSRSGDENAESGHNTNLIIFHKIKDFRRLANESIVSEEQTTLVYAPEVLEDSSVTDTHTYITEAGTTLVACSISDEASTTSKVLVKQEDGTYAEKLSTGYKLGEPFEVEGTIYVFGVADHKLVAFTSTDEGITWEGPYAIDTTRDWYEAPTSVIVNDEQVMLALSEVSKGEYKALRGYSGDTGALVLKDESALFTGYGAVGYTERFDLSKGESVSLTITPKTLVNSVANLFDIMFSDAENSFFGNVADSGSGVVLEMSSFSSYSTGAFVKYAPVTKGTLGTLTSLLNSINSGNISGDMLSNTYTVKFTRTYDDENPWVLTMTTTANSYVYTKTFTNTELSADAFKNGLYISAAHRSPQNATVSYEVTNPIKEEKTYNWSALRGYSGSAGSVALSVDKATFTGYGAMVYPKRFDLSKGESVSLTITPKTLVNSVANLFDIMFSDAENSFFGNVADSGSGVVLEMSSFGLYSTGAFVKYAPVTKGTLGTLTSLLNSINSGNISGDMLSNTYTVKFTRTYDDENPWVLTMTTTANSYVYTKTFTNTELSADAFKNGLYISAAHRSPQNATVSYEVTDPVEDVAVATTNINDRHMVSPVIMTAPISKSLTDADNWTYYDGGQSFANKIGNAYTNTKLQYFGLPYAEHDIRTIGWSDLKLFEVYETDDIRHDNQLNSGETTGNLYGYMTLQNAGYDYAAFVKVNTATQKLEFFTPAGLSAEITEEEMVLSKMPGGNNGFEIFWDETSGLYWLVTTEDTDSTSDSKETRVAIYYGTNAYDWRSAGVVAELSGDARVSAVVEGKQLVITALNKDIVQYTVPNFRELVNMSGLSDWVNIRGYNTATSKITSTGNKVTLAGYGGAMCNTKIEVQEGTTIEFTLTPTDLTNSPYFTVGLTNKANSFVGGDTDTGSGIAVTILPWSSLGGAAIRYSPVTSGQANPALASGALVGGSQVTATMLNNDFTFKFVKRSQTISGVDYSWYLEITEKLGGVVKTQNIKISELSEDCFDDGLYLIAGGSNGKYVSYEISDVTVTQPVVGDVNHDGEINILDIAALDYGIRTDSVASYEKHVYNVDGDESVTIDYQDVNAIRADVLAH